MHWCVQARPHTLSYPSFIRGIAWPVYVHHATLDKWLAESRRVTLVLIKTCQQVRGGVILGVVSRFNPDLLAPHTLPAVEIFF